MSRPVACPPTRPALLAWLALPAAFLLAPSPASANLRAPVVIPAAPSGALKLPADGLVVRGESLRFECGTDECAVRAEYRITASAAGHFAFEFVSPVEREVAVKIGPAVQEVTVTELARDPDEPQPRRRGAPATSYTARFEADLTAGDNSLAVAYRQPLGATEHDYGYMKKHGRFVQEFAYLLGPIKQWSLAPDFAIGLEVSMPREPPNWWKRTFGTVRGIACMRAWDDVLDGRGEQRGARFVYTATLRGRDFPDRLECRLGDEDLLPKAAGRR